MIAQASTYAPWAACDLSWGRTELGKSDAQSPGAFVSGFYTTSNTKIFASVRCVGLERRPLSRLEDERV